MKFVVAQGQQQLDQCIKNVLTKHVNTRKAFLQIVSENMIYPHLMFFINIGKHTLIINYLHLTSQTNLLCISLLIRLSTAEKAVKEICFGKLKHIFFAMTVYQASSSW